MFTWKDEGNAAYAAAITAPARTVRGAVTLEDGDGGEPLSILDSGDLQSLTIERGTQSAGADHRQRLRRQIHGGAAGSGRALQGRGRLAAVLPAGGRGCQGRRPRP